MAVTTQHVRQVRTNNGDSVRTDRVVEEVPDDYVDSNSQNTAARVIWLIASILIGLLLIRFVLALLGANPANAFANFIYSVTRPFVAPFFGLFNYQTQFGISRFEIYTLVAVAVYALIAFAIARLVTINQPREY